ncbi:MAG: hypothetical protein ACPGQS_13755 [Bradymonadia bacterium]
MTKIRLTAFLISAFAISFTAHAEDAEQTPSSPNSTDETTTKQKKQEAPVELTGQVEQNTAAAVAKEEEAEEPGAPTPASPATKANAEATTPPPEVKKPLFDAKKLKLKPLFSLKAHRESVDSFKVHSDGAVYDREPEDFLQLRLGLKARYDFVKNVFLKFNYEHDLISRRIAGGALTESDAFVRTDGVTPEETALRELNAEFRYKAAAVATGFSVSNWGLGLLSNAGRGDWQSESAYFGSPYGGDRVYRTRAILGPIPSLKHLLFLVAYDTVIDDDILVADDTANQLVTAIVMQPGQKNSAGIYAAFRSQEHDNDRTTDVAAFDLFAQYSKTLTKNTTFSIAGEGALIVGETDLGPNPTFPKHDVLQAGALIRTKLSHKRLGFIGDLLYASGDQNTDDDQINNFRVDPNLESGLILYRHVLNASTGHGPIAASDPDLVGYPSQDLERLANNRSISNTISFFPRAWWKFSPILETYGGVLFAFSEVSQIDPKNARLAGGQNRNAFDAEPGGYLGTEFDVGIRFTPKVGALKLNFGAEFGRFVFGDAFKNADQTTPSSINAARFYVRSTL